MSFAQPSAAPRPSVPAALVGAVIGGIAGALLWTAISYVTHFRIGYLSVGVGILVGLGAVRAAGGSAPVIGAVAAAVAVVAAAFGDVGVIYVDISRHFHVGLFDVISHISPTTALHADIKDDPMVLLFIAIAAFAAFRVGGTGRYRRIRRLAAPAGAQAQVPTGVPAQMPPTPSVPQPPVVQTPPPPPSAF